MASGYPSAPPPPYQPTNESYQQNPPNQPPYSQPYSAYPPQSYPNQPYTGQPYSQPAPDQPTEPFGSQPYHYSNADDSNDLDTAGAFTEKSIRAGTQYEM